MKNIAIRMLKMYNDDSRMYGNSLKQTLTGYERPIVRREMIALTAGSIEQ
ncbi:hypothetical protein [Clostridium sp. AN503]